MTIWSLDTESYYDKDFSLKTMGTWDYVFHPAADHYLASVAGSDGTRFVGHPKDAPWEHMHGGIWLSWNTGYDGLVYRRLIQDGKVPYSLPTEWHDPADLAAYLGYPRSLKMAVGAMCGEKLSKDTRDKMKGKRWHEMTPEFKSEVERYALADAEWCLKIWQDYGDKWPERERTLSRLTREMGWRGVRIDVPRVTRGIDLLQRFCWAAERKIPWSGDGPSLSYPRLVAACKEAGIDAPASVAMGDDGCEEWEARHPKVQWVAAMRIKRRCNALLKKLTTIRDRVREDETIPVELKYGGAYPTMRWSGTGSINWQNLSREPQFGQEWWAAEGKAVIGDLIEDVPEGVDLRACMIPRKGCKFAISDSAQIEVRCGQTLVGDTKAMELTRKGFSAYDAHSVTAGIATAEELPLKKTDLKRYTFAKGMRLACQYGSGHHKMLQMAPIYGLSNEFFTRAVSEAQVAAYEEYLLHLQRRMPTWWAIWQRADPEKRTMLVNAWLIVMHYRRTDTKTVEMWKRLAEVLRQAIGDDLCIELPSGREMMYRKVAENEDEITAVLPEFGKLSRSKLYAAMLFNHLCQGSARDVMADGWLRVAEAGHDVVLTVHDELVVEIPEDGDEQEIAKLMSVPPKWWPSLPVAAEAVASNYYCK